MNLAELIIELKTIGLDRVKQALKEVAAEGKNTEKQATSISGAFDKFTNIPGPLGEIASKMRDLAKGTEGAFTSVKAASEVFKGTAATSHGLGVASVAAATGVTASGAASAAASASVGKLGVSSATAAVGVHTLAKAEDTLQKELIETNAAMELRMKGMSASERNRLVRERDIATGFMTVESSAKKQAGAVDAATLANSRHVGSVSALRIAFTALRNPIAIIGAAIVIAKTAIEAFGYSMRNAANDADENAQKLGITLEAYRRLNLITSENGGTAETLTKIYDKLSRSLNKLDDDNEKTTYAFESLGTSLEELKGMKPEEVAAKLLKNYDALNGSIRATAAITQLLGPNFREVALSLRENGENAAEAESRLEKYGVTAQRVLVKEGQEQETAATNLKIAWEGLGIEIARWSSGMIQGFNEWAAEAANSFRKVLAGMREVRDEARGVMTIPLERRQELTKQANRDVEADPTTNIFNRNRRTNDRIEELYREELRTRTRNNAQADHEEEMTRMKARGAAAAALVIQQRSTSAVSPEDQRRAAAAAAAAEKERERIAKEIAAAGKDLVGIYEDQVYKGLEIQGIDTDRLKLQQKIYDTLEKIPNLTKEQKKNVVDTYLAVYDTNKARERQLDAEKAITAEYNKQAELMQDIRQRSAETLLTAQNAFKTRNLTRRDRDSQNLRDQITNPIDSAQRNAQRDIDRVSSQMGPLSQEDTAIIESRKQVIAQLEIERAAAIAAIDTVIEAQNKAEATIDEGMIRAIRNVLDTIPTMAEAVEQIFSKTFKSLEDSLVQFVMTGKFGFKDFVKVVLQELSRLLVQMSIVAPMMAALRAMITGGFGGGAVNLGTVSAADMSVAFDMGMPALATGTNYVPRDMVAKIHEGEAVVPRKYNPAAGGSMATSSNVTITVGDIVVHGGNTNDETGQVVSKAVVDTMKQIAQGEIIKSLRPGGVMYA